MVVRKDAGSYDVTDWRADPTAVGTSAAAINQCFADVPDGSRVEVPAGRYILEAPLSYAGKHLEIHGLGRVVLEQAFADVEPMLQATGANGSEFANLQFVGTDTASALRHPVRGPQR